MVLISTGRSFFKSTMLLKSENFGGVRSSAGNPSDRAGISAGKGGENGGHQCSRC